MNFISLGAGVQSSTMALMAAKGEITPMPDGATFADTGWESQEIYSWLDWLETQLPFPVYRVSAGNIRKDLEDHIKGERMATPPYNTTSPRPDRDKGKLGRKCSDEYKKEPQLKKIRELMGLKKGQWAKGKIHVTQWIGISLDEISRMKPAKEEWITIRWPLIEQRMTRWDCLRWMERNGYPEPKKSSCIGCPYHDDVAWREMKINRPEEFADAVLVDNLIRNGVKGTTEKIYTHKSLTPLEDVDFRNLEDLGQGNMFNNECEGMCGV